MTFGLQAPPSAPGNRAGRRGFPEAPGIDARDAGPITGVRAELAGCPPDIPAEAAQRGCGRCTAFLP
eukprot:383974-Alexandrium_andersonii.AAC.1